MITRSNTARSPLARPHGAPHRLSPDLSPHLDALPGPDPAASPEDEDAPAATPDYGDLLDAEWLERSAEARERDDDLVDVGLTLDLDDRDAEDELACVLDLDVGTLLTSLPPPGLSRDGVESAELGDGTFGVGALRELLLPDDSGTRPRGEEDEEIGNDERFPVFDAGSALPSVPPGTDDGEGEA